MAGPLRNWDVYFFFLALKPFSRLSAMFFKMARGAIHLFVSVTTHEKIEALDCMFFTSQLHDAQY